VLLVINLVVLGGWAYGISRFMQRFDSPGQELAVTSPRASQATTAPSLPSTLTPASQPSYTPTTQPSLTSIPETLTASPQPISTLSFDQGVLILALDEGGNKHLFAYQPEVNGAGQPLPLTRLTYGPWDDITPAISPDGQTVAFASNRSGYWDIYLLNLESGAITRLTDSLAYEASPSWSPDNQWLAYEAYLANNLEIVIQSVQTPSDVLQLTDNPAADFSPAWSPEGRQITFVSDRSGEDDIWLADLDKSTDHRFINISQDANDIDTRPAWSPDGKTLAWVVDQDGVRSLYLSQMKTSGDGNQAIPLDERQYLGSGDYPVWSADSKTILSILQAPNHIYLTAYPVDYPGLALPTLELPGAVSGISWTNNLLTPALQTIYQGAAQATSTPLYLTEITTPAAENGERYQLVPLKGVAAPQAYLHDQIDESFSALRSRIASQAGWDFLGTLENAYVPLTTPLDPGMGDDWLYTGRAIAINTLPLNAGWMAVVREDYGTDTYWRVYVRALYQDGSAGLPLHEHPWDFDGRYSGDTTLYEQGGKPQASIPPGYWIDFTELAQAYGWERLPALVTWRAFYPGARFNEFVSPGGMSWQDAMLELYPPEALVTPTLVIPPTRTPTPTLRWYVSPTPTTTPTVRPTFTPITTVLPGTPIPGG
jgi:TolB protein